MAPLLRCVFAAVFGLDAAASAAPAGCARGSWDGNPLAWDFGTSCEIRSTGSNDLLYLRDSERSAEVAVSARLRPEASGTNTWGVLGIAVADDGGNFWHLALVQAPATGGRPCGKRFFELSEMRAYVWNSQSEDRLQRTAHKVSGGWEYGVEYDARIECSPSGIRGEVRDSAGNVIFVCAFAFPPAAADGTAAVVSCGRPALHAGGGFSGAFSRISADASSPRPKAVEKFPPYAPLDPPGTGFSGKATGFIHVERADDGRWWTVDPHGRGMTIRGVDHIKYRGLWSQRTKRSIYAETNRKRFPDRKDWVEDTLAKLKAWGFNALGTACDKELYRRGFVHSIALNMGDRMCWESSVADSYICPDEHRPCSAFPNVFSPLFAEMCDFVASRECAPERGDQWLAGYYIDNELAWWGRGGKDTGLFDAVAKLPDGHSAKDAQKRFLEERGVTGAVPAAVKLDFLKLAAEKYFSTAAAAIRRHDPDHMILGARFAGLGGADPAVWEIAGKYCDVVTFNCYPWADIDLGEVRMARGPGAERAADAFAKRFEIVKRPMFVTEWSFPALDAGRPCFHGAGQRFRTQTERARATELFAKTMLAMPFLAGYNYFMWVDEPAAGMSDAFPEDSNYGLVSETGEPYREITEAFARVHGNAAALRFAPPPRAAAAPRGGITAAEFLERFEKPPRGGVSAKTSGASGTACTAAGLEISWREGAARMLEKVRSGERAFGTYTAMLCDIAPGGKRRWRDVRKIVSAQWSETGGRGALTVAGEFRDGANAFRLVHRITPLAGRAAFLCELVRAENIGEEPIKVDSFLFRQYADFAPDGERPQKVPNLWKSPNADAWFGTDGAFYGGITFAPEVESVYYHRMGEKLHQHPDAIFKPSSSLVLKPGASYETEGGMWFLAVCGTGGKDAWDAFLAETETCASP